MLPLYDLFMDPYPKLRHKYWFTKSYHNSIYTIVGIPGKHFVSKLANNTLLRLSPQSDPLPPSLVDLVRNSPISSVDDLKLLLQQETDAIGTNEHHTHKHTNNTDTEEVSVWVCLERPEEIGM